MTLYEYSTTSDGYGNLNDYETAQTFTVGTVGPDEYFEVTASCIKVYRTDSSSAPGNLYFSIRAVDGSGAPSGSDLVTGSAVNVNSVTTNTLGEWITSSMGGYTLSANTTYALVIRPTNTTDYCRFREDESPSYGGGQKYLRSSATGSWTGYSTDLDFKIYGKSALTSGLVNYWKFDETSGTTAYDAHGSNDGTITGGVSINQTGKLGKSFYFDGSDDYVTLSSIPHTGTGDFSIFAWVKTTDSGSRRTIINYGTTGISSNEELYLYKEDTNGKLKFDLRNFGGPTSSVAINDGNWKHVGVVNNGGTIQLYVNGVASGPSQSMSPNIKTGSQQIGCDTDAGGPENLWLGNIDEVGIWNRALTADEVSNLYNNGDGLPYPFTGTGGVTYYTLTTVANPTDGGTINPTGGSYSSGSVVSITASANTGYSFNNWSGDASGSDNPLSVTMSSDKTITGNFVTSGALGTANQNSIYIKDTAGTWQSFNHYEYFRVRRRLNQVNEFEFKIFDVTDTEKVYFKEQAEVLFFADTTLLLKGRVQEIKYATSYEAEARGFGMEAKLLDKEFIKSGDKRVQWTNESAQTIVKEILSENSDGNSPWIISPDSGGIFSTDYGDITYRVEYGNRLNALGKLAEAINYDWWVGQDSSYNDYFYMKDIRGNQTSVVTFTPTGSNQNCWKTSQEKDVTNLVNYCYFLGYGDGINQLKTSVYSASTIYSTLASDISDTDTTITLVDASSFPTSGTIRIAEEQITYTGKSGNNLTGCTRGANSTTAKAHKKGVYVEKHVPHTSPETDSSIDKYGLMEYTIIDKSVMDEQTAELIASKYLLERFTPIIRIKIKPDDPLGMATTIDLGDKVTVEDDESGISGDYRVVGIEYVSDYGVLDMEIELSNRSLEFIEQMQKAREQQESMAKYMQGATNIYAISEAENCDDSHYLNMRFYIPDDAVAINSVKLSFKMQDFRAYNQSIGGGGGFSTTSEAGTAHTHNISINNEPASGYVSVLGFASNTLYSAYGSGGVKTSEAEQAHTHQFTLPNHTHSLAYGIYEETLTNPSVTLYIGPDGGSMTSQGTYTTSENSNIDVTSEIQSIGAGNWANIQFRPNKRMRIEANAYIKMFIESK